MDKIRAYNNGNTLTDESPMPYGSYKGTKMANLEASYLIFLYDNDKCSDSVKRYIENNIDILRKECGQ